MLCIQTRGHEQRSCFFFNVAGVPSSQFVYRILARAERDGLHLTIRRFLMKLDRPLHLTVTGR